MDLKDFDFNKLDKKQKMMIPIGAVLVIFILWQVFSMFGGGDADFVDQGADTAAVAPGTFAEGEFGGPPGAAGPREIVTTEVQEIQPAPPTQEELAELENAKQMRRVYLTLLQQYQIATVQRLLAETRATIAENDAKLSKQKLEKARSDAQAAQLEGGTSVFDQSGQLTVTPTGVAGELTEEEVGPSDKYSVSYIGNRNGKWSAIIMIGSKHVDVQVGSRLPDDSEVMSINSDSVLIAKNMKRRLISIPSSSRDLFKQPASTAPSGAAAGASPPETGGFTE